MLQDRAESCFASRLDRHHLLPSPAVAPPACLPKLEKIWCALAKCRANPICQQGHKLFMVKGATKRRMVEPDVIFYAKSDYFSTKKFGNKISPSSVIRGTEKISVRGKTVIEARAIIRGDLARVNIGQHCIIGEGVVLKPSEHRYSGEVKYIPLPIGDHTVIEKNSIVQAAQIGQAVHIGKDCIIGRRCILSDCCKIEDGSVLAPGTVVAPFSIMAGFPAQRVGRLPYSFKAMREQETISYYKNFQVLQESGKGSRT
eukprot:g22606.t1